MLHRRAFLGRAAGGMAVGLAGTIPAQQTGLPGAQMSGEGYVPVRRPPRPGAGPSMPPDERDELARLEAALRRDSHRR